MKWSDGRVQYRPVPTIPLRDYVEDGHQVDQMRFKASPGDVSHFLAPPHHSDPGGGGFSDHPRVLPAECVVSQQNGIPWRFQNRLKLAPKVNNNPYGRSTNLLTTVIIAGLNSDYPQPLHWYSERG